MQIDLLFWMMVNCGHWQHRSLDTCSVYRELVHSITGELAWSAGQRNNGSLRTQTVAGAAGRPWHAASRMPVERAKDFKGTLKAA